MVETAALLVDHVLPHRPVRQWVLSFPYPLHFLLASQAQEMGKVLAIVNRVGYDIQFTQRRVADINHGNTYPNGSYPIERHCRLEF